ncbi:hypothetical protein PENSPDRAFT_690995 [Peniophora sp. CONT]|nr:hypothetical protein PENSPDRAFT_690995 [Peniophora sp. CONT]
MPPLPLNTVDLRLNEKIDWEALRKRSLEPGGFGEERVTIWPKLLHVQPPKSATPDPNSSLTATSHADERQIRLDTDRSFVLYPAEDEEDDRSHHQNELYDLIVSVFRKYPGLNYFQGYHDIVTVFFLTLPPELQLPAVEKMSLHRLRDAMGKTLEPLMGMLRILQRLLHLADAEFAGVLEDQMPIPYAALSHILTLFAHDVPTLALVQHVFDYLLARPPIAVVYLAAAIMLTHRDEILLLEREGEEGMIHSVLTSLPSFVDAPEADILAGSTVVEEPSQAHTPEAQSENNVEADWLSSADIPYPVSNLIHEAVTVASSPDPLPDNHSETTTSELYPDISPASIPLPPSRPPSPPPSPPPPRRPPQSLPALLKRSDDLMTLYPPSHPDLRLEATLGLASVVRTWSEDPTKLPEDEEAERMVVAAVDIVYPDAPEPEPFSGDEKHPHPGKEREHAEKEKRRRRKLHKSKQRLFGGLIVVERRTMLAGAALVLGVAMAVSVYSTRGGGGAGGMYGHGRGAGIAGFVGAGERLWSAFGGGRGFGF